MDLGLKDRVALVAAASKGIGFAAARELAREGARVFLCSRDEKRAVEAAQKIQNETGAAVAGIGADVTDDQAMERFVSLGRERTGRIDIRLWIFERISPAKPSGAGQIFRSLVKALRG